MILAARQRPSLAPAVVSHVTGAADVASYCVRKSASQAKALHALGALAQDWSE